MSKNFSYYVTIAEVNNLVVILIGTRYFLGHAEFLYFFDFIFMTYILYNHYYKKRPRIHIIIVSNFAKQSNPLYADVLINK